MPETHERESDLIDAIYRGACNDEELVQAVLQLCRRIDGAAAVLGEMSFNGPPLEIIPVGDIDPHYFNRYPAYARFDPMIPAVMLGPEGAVANSAKAVPEEVRRSNPFVNEMLRPAGFGEAIAARKSLGNGRSGTISILQAIGREPFDDAAEATLSRIFPHLARAQQIRRLFKESQQRAAVLGSIVDRSSTGIIVLMGPGARFVNEAARIIGGSGDGFALDRQGQPIIADRDAAKRFATLRADVVSGGAGGILRLRRPSGRAPYLVLVARLPSNAGMAQGEQHVVLVAIRDQSWRTAFAPSLVAELLDLPHATAKLVCALLDGEGLRSYGMRNGISINTVWYHLKTAFARTGAHSQADLIRNALIALDQLVPLGN